MAPVKGAGLCRRVGRGRDQRAIRDDGEFFRDGREHLTGGAIVRIVVAREPVARVLVFTLGPRLYGLVRVALVGADEIKSAPRLSGVVDRDFELLAGFERARQRYPQFA